MHKTTAWRKALPNIWLLQKMASLKYSLVSLNRGGGERTIPFAAAYPSARLRWNDFPTCWISRRIADGGYIIRIQTTNSQQKQLSACARDHYIVFFVVNTMSGPLALVTLPVLLRQWALGVQVLQGP